MGLSQTHQLDGVEGGEGIAWDGVGMDGAGMGSVTWQVFKIYTFCWFDNSWKFESVRE